MAIAKTPDRPTLVNKEQRAAAFIAQAQTPVDEIEETANRKPIQIRVKPDALKRIDKGAARLGISRSAFFVQSAIEKLERMGS